jgi:hypothetical protein
LTVRVERVGERNVRESAEGKEVQRSKSWVKSVFYPFVSLLLRDLIGVIIGALAIANLWLTLRRDEVVFMPLPVARTTNKATSRRRREFI